MPKKLKLTDADLVDGKVVTNLEGVEILDLSECLTLTTVPSPPKSLQIMHLQGCISLVPTVETIRKLKAFGKTCHMGWPEHFERKTALIDCIRNQLFHLYEKNISSEGSSLASLFEGFLSRGPKELDDHLSIVKATEPFFDFIKKESADPEWMEGIARYYIDVDQPVAGFEEISVWISVSNQSNIMEKLDLVQQFMLLDKTRKSLDADSVIDYLTKNKCNIWARIAFPEEYAEINRNYTNKRKSQKLAAHFASTGVFECEPQDISPEYEAELEFFQGAFEGQTVEECYRIISERREALDRQESAEIQRAIEELTKAEIAKAIALDKVEEKKELPLGIIREAAAFPFNRLAEEKAR
ncbi:MAG: hypothetical protein K0R25_408 [Rickettsiaceae bacterium]|jgi:hypothetical protein|nr:hypothetical protein [Rickettsiaceae bacterium]